ncbi:hypothetical protein F3Y22_tig00018272pilonHSYRG00015 [Hibiscus syriacus]|uniref:Uncharacterized protein n=1 Tax=Hibiscus syriacus TaxID=106335 RepID=A0A6A3BVI2_HIBSY|nr:hypothetical protein F3Y22_tig00018272pilonHSYRG00015 [Hibiscus syriacus]
MGFPQYGENQMSFCPRRNLLSLSPPPPTPPPWRRLPIITARWMNSASGKVKARRKLREPRFVSRREVRLMC